jgi:hypothetical protein
MTNRLAGSVAKIWISKGTWTKINETAYWSLRQRKYRGKMNKIKRYLYILCAQPLTGTQWSKKDRKMNIYVTTVRPLPLDLIWKMKVGNVRVKWWDIKGDEYSEI